MKGGTGSGVSLLKGVRGGLALAGTSHWIKISLAGDGDNLPRTLPIVYIPLAAAFLSA
jgi:hypothetical protein